MLSLYRDIPVAERQRTHAARALLLDAAETAMAEGRWRTDDFNEYVCAVARKHELYVWPFLLRRLREAVDSSPSTA